MPEVLEQAIGRWKAANGCYGKGEHWPTQWDGEDDFWCATEGECEGGDVIRCMWNGGHNWLFNDAKANGGLVTKFLLEWTKPSHVGYGRSEGDVKAGQRQGEQHLSASCQHPPCFSLGVIMDYSNIMELAKIDYIVALINQRLCENVENEQAVTLLGGILNDIKLVLTEPINDEVH